MFVIRSLSVGLPQYISLVDSRVSSQKCNFVTDVVVTSLHHRYKFVVSKTFGLHLCEYAFSLGELS
jgi:hypothetical protein